MSSALKQPLLSKKEAAPRKEPDDAVGVPAAVINLIKSAIGTGVLTLPEGACHDTGAGAQAVIIGLMCMAGAWTFSLVGGACEKFEQSSTRDRADPRACGDFLKVWRSIVGAMTAPIIDFLVLTYALVICTMYVLTLYSFVKPLLEVAGVDERHLGWRLKALMAVLCFGMSRLRRMKSMAWTSILGNFSTFMTIVIILVRWLDGSYAPGGVFHDDSPREMPAFWSIGRTTPVFILRVTYSASAHFVAPQIYEQLKGRTASRLRAVTFMGYIFIGCIYASVSLGGSLTFGISSAVPIISSYAINDKLFIIARWFNFITIATVYPLVFATSEHPAGRLIVFWRNRKELRSMSPAMGKLQAEASEEDTDRSMTVLAVLTSIAGFLVQDLGIAITLAGAFLCGIFVWVMPSVLALAATSGAGPFSLGVRLERLGAMAAIAYGVLQIIYGSAYIFGVVGQVA